MSSCCNDCGCAPKLTSILKPFKYAHMNPDMPIIPAIRELIKLATLYTGDDYVELYSRDAQLALREELAKVLKRIKEEEDLGD